MFNCTLFGAYDWILMNAYIVEYDMHPNKLVNIISHFKQII